MKMGLWWIRRYSVRANLRLYGLVLHALWRGWKRTESNGWSVQDGTRRRIVSISGRFTFLSDEAVAALDKAVERKLLRRSVPA